ncbi:UNVERIFIED_CONTAM: hypothetical protein FKN15_003837 [Acipenser sinensis]
MGVPRRRSTDKGCPGGEGLGRLGSPYLTAHQQHLWLAGHLQACLYTIKNCMVLQRFQLPKAVPEPTKMRENLYKVAMYITGDMKDFRKFMQKKPFLLQLLEWSLRGLSQVIMVDNPLSGVLILVALILYNPWYTLTTTVGLLSSTLTALIIGQDSADVSKGVYGFNGALVALLIAVFSAMGDWYWWLLLPCCFAGASCTLLFSGLATLLKGWDIPVMVFPFNSALSLYMSATGPHNLYFPQQHVQPDIVLAHSNVTDLDLLRLLEGVPLGVGQIFACDDLWACGLILLGVFIFSPLLCVHALLGSCVGIITGKHLEHTVKYSGSQVTYMHGVQ